MNSENKGKDATGKRIEKKIIHNIIKCNHCGDIIESNYRHDFKQCSCQRVAVDGGHDYLRRCFKEPNDYTDMSVVEYYEDEKNG